MVTRLLLGCGTLGQLLADTLTDRSDELCIIVTEESSVETLRGDGIPAEQGDTSDPAALSEICESADSVIIAGDEPAQNQAAAQAASECYPDAVLVAYTGKNSNSEIRSSLRELTDRVIDPLTALTDRVLTSAGGQSHRVRQLNRTLRGIDGRLAVVMHDNPDPDAIASAMALVALAERVGTPSQACYSGEITHQENRALVNLLEFDLRKFDKDGMDLSAYDGIALVDHARAGVNDQLSPEMEIDIVIDHHPPREPVEANFVDLRSDVGATSTLLVDYFERLDIDPATSVATGLLFGIWIDTKEFRRKVAIDDFEAAAYLLPFVDMETLHRIESPRMSPETLETIGRAIRNRSAHGPVLTSCLGYLTDRDSVAQSADRLLDMDGISTTFVYGIKDDTIYASARARGTTLDVGEALRDAFDQIGDAGGHADMAAAQIPIGVLGDTSDTADAELIDIVREVIDERFLETIEGRPHWTVLGDPDSLDSHRYSTGKSDREGFNR